jgi:hypothetical protein
MESEAVVTALTDTKITAKVKHALHEAELTERCDAKRKIFFEQLDEACKWSEPEYGKSGWVSCGLCHSYFDQQVTRRSVSRPIFTRSLSCRTALAT